jgi:hypothetical protein
LKVEAIVDGEPLREYEDSDEHESAKMLTRYVEAKTGKHFGLRFMFTTRAFPDGKDVAVEVYLDGKSMMHWVCCEPISYDDPYLVNSAHSTIGTKTFE